MADTPAERIVPDTSVIIDRLLSEKLDSAELQPQEVILHEAVLAELEHQANQNKVIGFLGLKEVKCLRERSEKLGFALSYRGNRPRAVEIKHASLGEIDALIRQLAFDEDATLITADRVQSEVAIARGIKTIYFSPKQALKKLKLEKFFDEITMSVHLREGVMPTAKKGMPGKWEFVALRKKVLSQEEVQEIASEIIEEAKVRRDSFIEIERLGSTIIQLANYRIVITKPPFSDGWEITAVRPVKKLSLPDYKLSEKLQKRIAEQAEGILIAGAPGMGKSTFAQALAEFYAEKEKIVKTVEAPRDLVLPEAVTQYAMSHGDAQEIHDILLLSRPDYTMFDEMRNTDDFKLFADMRLAGVGMVGVVHGTNPVDAIQRFIGRIEMGVIPQVIDTVLFIKNGTVDRVLSLFMTVKVPSGMTEADLARPIVVINDFESDKPLYEIYTYGEQTVVVPVQNQNGEQKSIHKLATGSIKDEFRKYANKVEVEVLSDHKCIVYVPERDIPSVIGKQGKTISDIEKQLGMKIEVRELEGANIQSQVREDLKIIPHELQMKKNSIQFDLGIKMQHKDVDIYVDNELVLQAKAGKTGIVKIKRNNNIGQILFEAVNKHRHIELRA